MSHASGYITFPKLSSATALALSVDYPSRVEAGIVFALNETINEGHVFVPRETLGERAIEVLDVSADLIPPALDRLAQEARIRTDTVPINNQSSKKSRSAVGEAAGAYNSSVIYLTLLYFGEKGVAGHLKALANAYSASKVMNHSLFVDEQLFDQQRSAIEVALTKPVSVLTGGPGIGKTTCLKALITALETQGMNLRPQGSGAFHRGNQG